MGFFVYCHQVLKKKYTFILNMQKMNVNIQFLMSNFGKIWRTSADFIYPNVALPRNGQSFLWN